MQDWKYCCDILIHTGLFVLRNPVLSAFLFLVFAETIFELVIELSLFAFFVFALLMFTFFVFALLIFALGIGLFAIGCMLLFIHLRYNL